MSYTAFDTALSDYLKGKKNAEITVLSDLSEDDIMDASYYFRSEETLLPLEKTALSHCGDSILDVGACVGAHSIPLVKKGKKVTAIDISKVGVEYMKSKGVNAKVSSFQTFETTEKFDTILLLMNGIGLAGKLSLLESFLRKCYDLLKEGGEVLCDSTNVQYFYEDEEGAMWYDLNADYFGEFKFRMQYQDKLDDWFDWVYVDKETLQDYGGRIGFVTELIYENKDECTFLMKLKK